MNMATLTYTDSAAAGTIANVVFTATQQPTLAATNARTTTNAITKYIGGAPIRGTNETFTNTYGLYIDSANTTAATVTQAASLYIANAPTVVSGNTYALQIASGKAYIGGALQIPTGATNNYVLSSDASGNATWQDVQSILNLSKFDINGAGTVSILSATLITIPTLTFTPTVAGSYLVIFSVAYTTSGAGNNARTNTFVLALNGTTVTNVTLSKTTTPTTVTDTATLQAIITVNGSTDTIDARASVSAGNLIMSYRAISGVRISA
jgi:hypothetical protein